ncbi:hypothetical protein VaNZ11_005233 [Volvox africanus]|uniref:EF-hand domain-containing protein n=1 Tax=Volvox africanus TaxID=51714 RepID=A0ABQ5RZD2_9CHLO|nr:hypothetical protein VaNZ11_005233 [Volvox africanus]
MGRSTSLATLAAQSKKSVEIAVAHFRLSKTTKLLILLFAIGAGLIAFAAVLDKRGDNVQGNSLRWLYLVGTVATSMILWNGFVELVYLWLELKYFLRLMMLPASQLLFKVWLNSVTAFVSFEQLFRKFPVNAVTPQPLTSAERWIHRLLLCFLLFMCVCVAVTAACNVAVAVMYSEGSRQKIVAAVQHAYVMYRLIRKKLREGVKERENISQIAGRWQRREWLGSNGSADTPPPPPPPLQQNQGREPHLRSDASRRQVLSRGPGGDERVKALTMNSTAGLESATTLPENSKTGAAVLSVYGTSDASLLPLPPPPMLLAVEGERQVVQLGSISPSTQPQAPLQPLAALSNGHGGAATATTATTSNPDGPAQVNVTVSELGRRNRAAGDGTMQRFNSDGPDLGTAAAEAADSETNSASGSDCGDVDDDSDGGRGGACGACCGGLTPARRPEGAASKPSASASSVMGMTDSRMPSASLQKAMQKIRDSEMLHVRRTLLAALEVYDWLQEESLRKKSSSAKGGKGHQEDDTTLLHRTARLELHAIRQSGVRLIISPRALLDEMLTVYGGLSDLDIPSLSTIFQATVWDSVGLLGDNDIIKRKNFRCMFPRREDRHIAWDALDGDKDGKLTREDVKAAVVSFLQQERSMALTVKAVRRLTWSLQSSLIAIINGIFLVPVYLSILDVAHFFSGGSGSKTSLDIFSVYVLVVSLIFSEQIKHVLLGCVFIMTQQPFDVGEELVIEESPGWRVMGIVQDFNLFFVRVKKSTDGELVTLPLNRLASSRFTNLTRSDWKIEQNYFAVDASTPPHILEEMKAAAEKVINRTKNEYDELYGFLAVFHGFERPNKVVIRTFHRYKFNLSAPHKRIANARHGIISVIREVFDKHGIEFTELRMHMTAPPGGLQYTPGTTAAAAAAVAAGYGALGPAPDQPSLGEAAVLNSSWRSGISFHGGVGGGDGGYNGHGGGSIGASGRAGGWSVRA